MQKATDAVVDFVLDARLASMPAAAVAQGRRCVLDGLGVILAGSASAAAGIVRRHLRVTGGSPEATLIGAEWFRAPASLAARANAVAGHALDYDDTQLSNSPDRIFGLLMHPTIPPLSAALAVGERLGVSGADFLEAFLIGFEVECKIAEAIHPQHYGRGFHTSGTIGTFGAAAATAKLLGLSQPQLAMAISIAGSMSAGLRVNFGTMTKPLHVGRAAESGIIAAELAALGFTADPRGLDGPWGFFQVAGGGFDAERIIGRLGSPYTILDPGVSVKPYPSGSVLHPSMDALLELLEQHDVAADAIASIRLRAGSNILKPLRYGKATNELAAKFSIPFMLSAIALRRRAGIHEFTDEYVLSPTAQAMMDRVEVVFDSEIDALGFDRIRSVVELRLQDGRLLRKGADVYRGGPERPLTRAELETKFTECAELVLAPAGIPAAIAVIEAVDSLPAIGDGRRARRANGSLKPVSTRGREPRWRWPGRRGLPSGVRRRSSAVEDQTWAGLGARRARSLIAAAGASTSAPRSEPYVRRDASRPRPARWPASYTRAALDLARRILGGGVEFVSNTAANCTCWRYAKPCCAAGVE